MLREEYHSPVDESASGAMAAGTPLSPPHKVQLGALPDRRGNVQIGVSKDLIIFEPDLDTKRIHFGVWHLLWKGVSVLDYGYNYDSRFSYTGNVAADSYHHIAEDVEMLRQLKANVYRFSISWTRIFPDGTNATISEDGVRYYNELIDKLLETNVQPLVTMYHFDHPQSFEDEFGSWQNETMIDLYVNFADFLFKTFGDRVKLWTTFNEANQYCRLVYSAGQVPPGVSTNTGTELYNTCLYNMILAHGKAYRLYKNTYAATQNGRVGFSCLSSPSRPASSSEEDIASAESSNRRDLGTCAEPVIFGDWPDVVKQQSSSNIPSFTAAQTEMLTNCTDYLGINIYGGSHSTSSSSSSGMQIEGAIVNERGGGGCGGGGGGSMSSSPWIMSAVTLFVRDYYNNIPVFITENGIMTNSAGLEDAETRAVYASEYLRELVGTINTYGVNVFGYTMWSFLDDFEFSRGYSTKYGIVYVDYDSANLTRTLKESSKFFITMMETNIVPLAVTSSDLTTVTASSSSVIVSSSTTESSGSGTTGVFHSSSVIVVLFACIFKGFVHWYL